VLEGGEVAVVKVVIPFDYANTESLVEPDDARAIGFVVNIHRAKPSGLLVTDLDVDPDADGDDKVGEPDFPTRSASNGQAAAATEYLR
jgi:hypothetical protein